VFLVAIFALNKYLLAKQYIDIIALRFIIVLTELENILNSL